MNSGCVSDLAICAVTGVGSLAFKPLKYISILFVMLLVTPPPPHMSWCRRICHLEDLQKPVHWICAGCKYRPHCSIISNKSSETGSSVWCPDHIAGIHTRNRVQLYSCLGGGGQPEPGRTLSCGEQGPPLFRSDSTGQYKRK